MEPSYNLQPAIPEIIKKECDSFVKSFSNESLNEQKQRYLHDNKWKETEETLVEITRGIFDTL
jgi:hypothetical protein